MADPVAGPRQPDELKAWRNRLPELVLALAGGLAVNALSVDVGYGGALVAAGFAAVLLAADRVRRLPKRAPLVRIASVGALATAMVAMIVAVLVPESWQGSAVIVAVMFATGAVLMRAELEDALRTLLGLPLIGLGVAFIGGGVDDVRVGDTMLVLPLIGLGVALIGLGLSVLRDSHTLRGVAFIGAGIVAIGAGISVLRDGALPGVALIGLGVALICGAIALLRETTLMSLIRALTHEANAKESER